MSAWTLERRAVFRAMWDSGATYREIGDRLGLHFGSVKVIAVRLGMGRRVYRRLRDPKAAPAFDIVEAVAMSERGMTDYAIARHFDQADTVVSQRLTAAIVFGHGLPKPAAVARKCLRCRQEFDHAVNRVCDPCKESADWKSGGDYSVARHA